MTEKIARDYGQATGPRTDRSPTTSSNRPRTTAAPSRVQKIQQHRIQGSRTDIDTKTRATDPDWEGGGHGVNGNQKVANVTEIRRGMGVEVTERDRDEDRERGESVIYPVARSQQDRGPNLNQQCRTGGVSRPGASTYTPSHSLTYTPVPDKSFNINQIPTHGGR